MSFPRVLVCMLALALAGCRGGSASIPAGGTVRVSGDTASGTGTIRHFDLEGGFYAIRGDDSVTYDPTGGVPAEFRQDGLRVRFEARIRRDMAGIHMAGPIVDIIRLSRL